MIRGGIIIGKGSEAAKWWKKYHDRILGIVVKPQPTTATPLPHLLQSPSPNYSERGAKIDLVVVHDTEGSYSAAVSWLRNPRAQASAHVVLSEDGHDATQLVRWSKKAWSCMEFNSRSLNLEMAGKASVGYSAEEIDVAARIVAYWCKLYGIPVRHASGGVRSGITFHQELGSAGGGHSDPGWTLAQRLAFITKVKSYASQTFTPARWGRA
jgi:hypothetical protein